ncbi:MAG: hypothetical protein OXH31_08730 [Gammaproteobacteria bacterium]|nr:hypothetical protein [Gammaproteobacteria bacterium]
MPYRLHKDIENGLKNVLDDKSVLKTQFDVYYLCLLVGLASGTKTNQGVTGVQPFIDHFTDDYRPVKHLLIGLLIVSEIRYFGISMTDKDKVRSEIRRIVDPERVDDLTPVGIELLNAYACGGYEFLRDREFESSTIQDFLREYVEMVELAVEYRRSQA